MSKRLQINPGDKYGRLTILEEVGQRRKNERYFLCECSCINKTRKEISLNSLRMGLVVSCGCYNREKLNIAARTRMVDYTGNTFGRLTILSEAKRNIHNQRQVMAQCSCDGNMREYVLERLKSGETTSCGCRRDEIKRGFVFQLKDYQEKHQLFCKVEEIKDKQNGLGIEVKCKQCGEWFLATANQIQNRIASIEKPNVKYPGVERNFYCSEKCKLNCDTYNAQTIPRSLRDTKKQSRCNQSKNRKSLLQLQIDECGYNYCEKCGVEFDARDLIIHHNIMVGVDHTMADDMSHQLLVCKEHHEHKGC